MDAEEDRPDLTNDQEHDLLYECYTVLVELMEWDVSMGKNDAPAWRLARALQRKLARAGFSS